jgi:5-methylcytosine-specific restriction protein A
MPRAPRKCPRDGCEHRITTSPYCEDHTQHGWVNGGRTRTTTPEHREWAAAVLERDGRACRLQRPGCIGYANEADHITPVSEHGPEFDLANGQAVCRPCHAKKSSEEGNRARRKG